MSPSDEDSGADWESIYKAERIVGILICTVSILASGIVVSLWARLRKQVCC